MGVGQPGSHLLKLFGAHVAQAFGHTPYWVGSSLTQKSGWRDVDVRLMMPDDEYEAAFGEHPSRVAAINWAWSEAGQRLTRLPIDFQIQQHTAANAEFDGVRSALILLDIELPTALTG